MARRKCGDMQYIAVGLGFLFIAFKFFFYLRHKKAVDRICSNYQLDPKKVSVLAYGRIEMLELGLYALHNSGDYQKMHYWAEKFR